MRHTFKLYTHYIAISIKSIMQYKVSFLLNCLGQFLVSFNVFLGIFFLFQRFSNVKGFTYNEVLLCFSIVLMEFSLTEMYARGFDSFSNIVKQGEFDRIMVRPRSEILQVLGSRFELSRIGRLIQAIAMFVYAIYASEITWTFFKVLTVIFMLMGGMALFTGIFLIYATLCFYTLEGLEFINILTNGAREYGKYPLSVYGKRMLQICTFIIPYALVQYYPLLYILEKRNSIFYMFVPLLAFLFLIPCYLCWKIGILHYKSSGS